MNSCLFGTHKHRDRSDRDTIIPNRHRGSLTLKPTKEYPCYSDVFFFLQVPFYNSSFRRENKIHGPLLGLSKLIT